MEYIKTCTICQEVFTTKYERQNVCSFECRMIANRDNSRKSMRIKRKKESMGECYFCGYKEVTENHHENNQYYRLCPNHHALITRGLKTWQDLEKEFKLKIVEKSQ